MSNRIPDDVLDNGIRDDMKERLLDVYEQVSNAVTAFVGKHFHEGDLAAVDFKAMQEVAWVSVLLGAADACTTILGRSIGEAADANNDLDAEALKVRIEKGIESLLKDLRDNLHANVDRLVDGSMQWRAQHPDYVVYREKKETLQ